MLKAGLNRGWMAVGLLVIAAGTAAAGAGELKAKDVGHGLAGEWEGQLQLRSSSGKLSASLGSMSAVLDESSSTLEMYYEGFAFGEAVDGAMILSFRAHDPGLAVRDRAVQFRMQSSVGGDEGESPDAGDSFAMMGMSEAHGEVRTLFTRASHDVWDIECQQMDEDGEWMSVLTLQLDRMDEGERSAAADQFAMAGPLRALRRERALASVPTDE